MKMRILMSLVFLMSGFTYQCFCQSAEEFFNEGYQQAKAANYTTAIITYTKAIIKNPYEWKYYQCRSYAYTMTKDLDNALSDINMALKLKPKYENVDCLASRARIFIEMRKYETAIEDLNYVIEYFPFDFQTKFGFIHLDRGKAFLYSGQKDKACLDFNESLSRKLSDAQQFITDFCK
jgi:tetratricopeptide (TPR) repeat protein